jgi:hypothetical protein
MHIYICTIYIAQLHCSENTSKNRIPIAAFGARVIIATERTSTRASVQGAGPHVLLVSSNQVKYPALNKSFRFKVIREKKRSS